MSSPLGRWWEADKHEAHESILAYVSEIDRVQSDIFERLALLGYLYDPNEHTGLAGASWNAGAPYAGGPDSKVSENVIASNIDTVVSAVAPVEVRSRVMTDDADWSQQRRAKHLEWYADGLAKITETHATAKLCFRDCALKGVGLAKVFCDPNTNEPRVERVLVDDIRVDEGELRSGGKPTQMHQLSFVDREVLAAAFPENRDDIYRSQSGGAPGTAWKYFSESRNLDTNRIVVIESWRLPIGKPGTDGYKPGRHVISIDGSCLADDSWEKPFFPFARIAWTERVRGWYSIGLAERIAGHQRRLNKLNWQVDRQLDQLAVPTTFVRMADAALAVKTTNRVGTIVPIKGEVPQTVIPQAVSAETYNRLDKIKDSAYEESGVSRLAASSKKPGGLDSGAALREYRDQTTQRFAIQEQAYERFILDIVWLLLDCAKDLGADAPVVVRKSKLGLKKIKWGQVDMGELKVQLQAASDIAKTPAGRAQLALEWAQAGVISMDEFRWLSGHPDPDAVLSLYTAAYENIGECIEYVLDGELVVPEPYQNLKMGVWMFQQSYLKVCYDAPEEILEGLRQWITQASFLLDSMEGPVMPEGMPSAPGQSALAAGTAAPMNV